MKEYKYLKEWTKKKKKITYYCVVIALLIILIVLSLLIFENLISKVTLRIGMSIILILSIIFINYLYNLNETHAMRPIHYSVRKMRKLFLPKLSKVKSKPI